MFYNPLLDNIAALTDQQLEQKLNELVRKYVTAQGLGNNNLQLQLSGAVEAYRNEIVNRTFARQLQNTNQNKNEPDPFSVIDIN
jgi:hypothetical protein